MTPRKHWRPAAALILASAVLTACGPSEADVAEATIDELTQSYGNCVVNNVGVAGSDGVAAYRWLKVATGDVLAIQCATEGPFRDDVTLLLPSIRQRGDFKPGEYRIVDRDSARPEDFASPNVAFADFSQELDTITTYRATSGTVKIVEVRPGDSVVVGTYVLALRRLRGSDRAPQSSAVGGAFAARVAPPAPAGAQ